MTAYIEYVFLENFLLDGLLLFGACRLTKTRVRYLALALSCVCGGVYALLSPFIRLPIPLDILLKFSVGACLCLLAFGRIKNRKEWGRYAFFCSAFFLFTFAVGGFLTAVWSRFPKKIPFIFVLLAIAVLLFALETFFGGMRRKQKAFAYIRNCIIQTGEKQVTARGYLDSGNLAVVNGLPVCFISPETLYSAFGESALWGANRKFAKIVTVSGEKEIAVYLGKLALKNGKNTVFQTVYFSPSKHMLFREYEILLPACMIENKE